MENPIRMDDLGGKPIIFGNTHIVDDSNQQQKNLLSHIQDRPRL